MSAAVHFEDLDKSDLIVDCVYEGGPTSTLDSEPFHKLIPGCENAGGFRKKLREDGSGKYAYVVLYTSMSELEWPDFLDRDTGVFRYYGDNRKPGRALIDTKKKGNKVLEDTFSLLNSGQSLEDMPPFLVFTKTGVGRDIRFLGLAAPGNPKISSDKDLVAFWRTMNGERFQNYEAYFTILDTGKEPITRKWLESLIDNHESNLDYAPSVWKQFIENGRQGIVPLQAENIVYYPPKEEQLPSDQEGKKCLQIIRLYYKNNAYGFEVCAKALVEMMDTNIRDLELTRPWRDGGRDGIGKYEISTGRKLNDSIKIDFALEAKCYSENNSVGVKEMSRLISRIRYRQFGIMVTTSYIDKQAYSEVREDQHPILMITAVDIAHILRTHGIDSNNIRQWLESLIDNRV